MKVEDSRRPNSLSSRTVKLAFLLAISVLFAFSGCANANAQQPTASPEDSAWSQALSTNTPQAYLDFLASYPGSAYIKVYSGTVRGRYYMTMGEPVVSTSGVTVPMGNEGVFVTVAGTDVLVFLSVEDALALGVVDFKPARSVRSGTQLKTPVTTFNVKSFEMQGPCLVQNPGSANADLAKGILLEPKDILNSVLVLNADGSKVLALDLRKAKVAEHADTSHATYPNSARRPSSGFNPESQTATYSQTVP